jgi:hypothetical protein
MSVAFELITIGSNPTIQSTLNVMVSGRCPDGVIINLLGITNVDEKSDVTNIAFEVIIPAGMREQSLETTANSSSLMLQIIDDGSNTQGNSLFYQVSFKTEDANSSNWELDFNVKTAKNSGTYTFTKKRFH